jgi:Flp pilus assembly protein TadG
MRAFRSPPASPARAMRPRGQRGGAAVEFAIVLPLFCLVLFGIIDYGWYFYQKFTLASAVRDGVRTGVTVRETDNPDCWQTAVIAAKKNLAAGSIVPTSVSWGPSVQYNGTAPTRTLTLSGTYTFTPLVGFVPLPKAAMTYTMTMLLEQQSLPP